MLDLLTRFQYNYCKCLQEIGIKLAIFLPLELLGGTKRAISIFDHCTRETMGSLEAEQSYPESYPPFSDTGSLKGFKAVPLTPIIGTEYKDVDITEWLRAPNSDDLLRDLSLVSKSSQSL